MTLPATAALLLALSLAAAPGQEPSPKPAREPARSEAPPIFAEQNILSPFRNPEEVYAPPDAVYRELRIMQALADDPSVPRSYDAQGREICDHPAWREAHARLQKLRLDLGYLARILRRSKSGVDRDTALYGAFFGDNPNDVFNLIAHIPGEPVRATREKAYPRAIAYLRAHLGRRYGDLSEEEKAALALPEIGSPAAKAMGLTRAPRDEDYLYGLNLVPFFQLLYLDSQPDQAQALWFLKECARIRKALVQGWLEPAVPRLKELLASSNPKVRSEAVGLLQALDGKRRRPPADGDTEALSQWSEQVLHDLYPPIRRLSEGLVLLGPGEERDALVAAGRAALRAGSLGEAGSAVTEDGERRFGFRVLHVPDSLTVLGIPDDALITAVNGVPVRDGAHLLEVIEQQVRPGGRLLVEFVHRKKLQAVEYRIGPDS